MRGALQGFRAPERDLGLTQGRFRVDPDSKNYTAVSSNLGRYR